MSGGCPAPLINALQIVALVALFFGSYVLKRSLRQVGRDFGLMRDANLDARPPAREARPPSLAERLAALDDLRDREVIGPDEYTERRQRILDEAAGRPR